MLQTTNDANDLCVPKARSGVHPDTWPLRLHYLLKD